MTVKMIMAVGENWELGHQGRLLWSLPEDLANFKQKTLGKSVVMGYNTFLGLPFENGLPDRTNFVITSDNLDPYLSPSKKDIKFITKDAIYYILAHMPMVEYWIIGGSKTYDDFIELVDEIHLTRVYNSFENADCFVGHKTKEVIDSDFSLVSVELHEAFQIQVLVRQNKNKENNE